MFLAVTVRLGAGRSDADKHRLVDALMDRLDELLGDDQRTMMLSVECQEIDPTFRVNKNNLRPLVAERRGDRTGHGEAH
jgi:5-carboxymethyl-2-hydroxymuconate isomerase